VTTPQWPAVPAPAPQTQPAQSGAPTYTHRTWKDEYADALSHVAGIFRDLEDMDADLADVQAGQTHRRLVGECRETAMQILVHGVWLVDTTDARYVPVYEAIQRAGGQDEVAKRKRYHDRG